MSGRALVIKTLTVCVLAACSESQESGSGSGSESESESESGSEPEPDLGPLQANASIPIEGGSIELPDGARVEFPAGALSEQTDISFHRLDCGGIYQAASFGSCRYAVVGPEQVLVAPYQLRLPSRAPARASQKIVDGLVVLIGSEQVGDMIVTTASVFGEFASWSAAASTPTDACVMPDFEPCGGELLGSWMLTGGCGTLEQMSSIYFTSLSDAYASCEPSDHYQGYPFTISGALDFNVLGYQMSSAFDIDKHTLITEDCLALVGETCSLDLCTSIDGVCECLLPKAEGEGGSGNDVWSVGDPGTVMLGDVAHRYCIAGDTLTIEWAADTPYYMVYTRQ